MLLFFCFEPFTQSLILMRLSSLPVVMIIMQYKCKYSRAYNASKNSLATSTEPPMIILADSIFNKLIWLALERIQ